MMESRGDGTVGQSPVEVRGSLIIVSLPGTPSYAIYTKGSFSRLLTGISGTSFLTPSGWSTWLTCIRNTRSAARSTASRTTRKSALRPAT